MAALVMKSLAAVVSFGFNLVLARLLGAEGSGLFFLALMITTICSILSQLGLGSTFVRYTAAHALGNEWGAIKGLYHLCKCSVPNSVRAHRFSLYLPRGN